MSNVRAQSPLHDAQRNTAPARLACRALVRFIMGRKEATITCTPCLPRCSSPVLPGNSLLCPVPQYTFLCASVTFRHQACRTSHGSGFSSIANRSVCLRCTDHGRKSCPDPLRPPNRIAPRRCGLGSHSIRCFPCELRALAHLPAILGHELSVLQNAP
jgi:hypothetical protein